MATEAQWEKAGSARQTLGLWGESESLNERLLNAILSISRCATLEEALEPLLDAALDLTKMDGGGVYWVQDDVAVLRHHRGLPEAFLRRVRRMPLGPLPVQVLLHLQEPVEMAEISPIVRRLLHRYGIHHAFSFPLQARGTLFGFLNVGSTRMEPPEKADIQALWVLVKEIESLFFRLYSEKALRESEQRYRTLWESALDGIVLYDLLVSPREGGFVDVNDCLCRMLGYAREEFLRLSPVDVVEDDAKEAIPGLVAKILQSGRLLFEIVLVAKNGRRIPVEVNVSVVQFAERRVALAVIRDVTERKRMEEMLRQANERLEEQVQARTSELNLTIDRLQGAMEELRRRAAQLQKITLELSEAEERERQRLAQFLHNDLQQILAAAKFHLSILGSRIAGDPAAREIQEQIKGMLKDAIEKSRSLSHELVPPVLYHGGLDAVFDWLAGQMQERHGLTVHVEIRGQADSRSEPVRSFLYRAGQEILFNTVKHAQVQEARLRLQRVRDELWLTLSDKGRGFDPASLARTAGFGLFSVRERAELLGGRTRIKSAPGKGSTFFIAVPDRSA